jgi:hypothetical protein
MQCPFCKSGRLHDNVIFAGGSSLMRECSESNESHVKSCYACGYLTFSDPVAAPTVPQVPKPVSVIRKPRANRGKTCGDINIAAVYQHLDALKYWSINGASIAECNRKMKGKGVDMSDNTLRRYLCKIAILEDRRAA